MSSPVLSPRLAAAASFVRSGAKLADIGTDHAALPISLTSSGTILDALATDLSQSAIQIAESRIAEACLSEQIHTLRTNGLHGVDSFAPTDIAICGMGGKTILDILSPADWIRNPEIRLILQPQTFIPLVRKWLLYERFRIDDEQLILDRHKYYTVLCAHYAPDMTESPWTDLELLVGRHILAQQPPELEMYLSQLSCALRVRIDGLRTCGKDSAWLESRQAEIDERIRFLLN